MDVQTAAMRDPKAANKWLADHGFVSLTDLAQFPSKEDEFIEYMQSR